MLTVMQDSRDNETNCINGTLLNENVDEINSIDNLRSGVVVQLDGSLALYGSTRRLYRLSRGIIVNKFSTINVTYSTGAHDPQRTQEPLQRTQEITICLYDEIDYLDLKNCPSRCFRVNKNGTNVMNLASAFNSRIAIVRYVAFEQEGLRSKSTIDSLIFSNRTMTSIFDDDDKCADPNARRSRKVGCVCMDGYASSNGGKVQGQYDTCIGCLSETECSIDASVVGSSSIDKNVCSMVSISPAEQSSCGQDNILTVSFFV